MALSVYQPSFVGGIIGPSVLSRIDLARYGIGCEDLLNMQPMPHGGVNKRSGFRLVHEIETEARLIPFIFNSTGQSYALVFGNKKMYVAYNGGLIADSNGQPISFTTPYTIAQAKKLSYAQCADILYLAHGEVAPYKLSRYSHNDWRFTKVNFAPPSAPLPSIALESDIDHVGDWGNLAWRNYYYGYTYIDANGNESLLGGIVHTWQPVAWASNSKMDITIQAVTGAVEYKIYKKINGSYGYIGSLFPDSPLLFVDDFITPDTTKGPPQPVDLFQQAGDYPGQVCFYQQRLIYAASNNKPQTIWMSRSGSYENFSNNLPITDDGSIEITLASNEVAMPVWMAVLRSLVLGAGGGVWEVASRSEIFTPSTLSSVPQNYRGCEPVRPVIIGNQIIYVMRGGRQVYEMAYDFGSDAYADKLCSILAPHLFVGKKVGSMVYQAAPYSMVWLVMSDGSLLSLTFIKEQDIYAWARHTTKGEFKSLCVLPGEEQETLYAVVKRGDKYFLEMMEQVFENQDVKDAFFVDCGVSYDNPGVKVKKFSGLTHLEGQAVVALSNGKAQPAQMVKDGSITLDRASDKVHVGLPYDAELKTLPLQIMDGMGSSIGMRKRIDSVAVMFYRTVTCRMGRGDEDIDETPWRSTEPYGEPIEPKTTTREVMLRGGWRDEIELRFVSDKPLPMTVLSLAPKFNVNA